MILELHIIQNFAPSNLNRDDANAPKECMFGGYRRARISSQCIKSSIRKHEAFGQNLVGSRSRKLPAELVSILGKESEYAPEEIKKAVEKVFSTIEVKVNVNKKKGKEETGEIDQTEVLLHIGPAELDGIKELLMDNFEEFSKDGKVSKDMEKQLKAVLTNAPHAIDVAMFGRMVASTTYMNVDAACQVAHAISTNAIDMEVDFYTAVDDLVDSNKEDQGAGMMGLIDFNSPCYYRYSLVNIEELSKNLGGNSDLAAKCVRGYVESSIKAIPTGKQNSFAAHNPPSYVKLVLKDNNFATSLANAFINPTKAKWDAEEKTVQPLDKASIKALKDYEGKLLKMYDDISQNIAFTMESDIYDENTKGVSELLNGVEAAIQQKLEM